jgi:SynChlorMet cassette radical SAM/SPASM protein ScmE
MTLPLMKTPRSVDIEITNGCNLRCAYCSHFTSAGDVAKDLPLDEWRRFFAELQRCAVMNVTLSGGEPFYRQDLKEIIASIVENRMRFSILSNGTLIEPEMASFLAAAGRCDSVQVSIDGAIDITHDAFRGEGNFVKAINGIKTLQRFNVPVAVRVTIHRKNVHELDAVAALLLEEIGLPSFSTNAASYMGLCRKNTEQTQLSVAERSLAMETLLRLADKYSNRISATAGPLAEATMWAEMKEASREGKPQMEGRGFLTGCGGPFKSIAVRADGAYVPCSQLGHIVLGHINRDDLCDIWQNHPALWEFRNRRLIPLSSFDFCQGCPYINYCTGNCPALSYNLTGEVNHPSPDACLRLFEQQGGSLPERLLYHEPATV